MGEAMQGKKRWCLPDRQNGYRGELSAHPARGGWWRSGQYRLTLAM